MSRLEVFAELGGLLSSSEDAATIADELAGIGVTFERWSLRALPASADSAAILAAYAPEIEALKTRAGYRSIDAVSVLPDHPDREAMRQKFLAEHTHAEDEVRFFVAGEALFTLHAAGRVWNVTCGAGDLMSVPAGMPHWFDMGETPRFTAIRLFVNPDGWVAAFTGDAIHERFPRFTPMAA